MALLIRALKCERTHVRAHTPVQKSRFVGFLGDWGAAGHPKLPPVRFRKTRTSENEFGHCRTNLSLPPKASTSHGKSDWTCVSGLCPHNHLCIRESETNDAIGWVLGEAGAAVSGVRVQNERKPKALTKRELCEPGCSRWGLQNKLGNGRLERSFKQEAGVADWAKMSCRCVENPMVGESPSSPEGDKQDGERLERCRREGDREALGSAPNTALEHLNV